MKSLWTACSVIAIAGAYPVMAVEVEKTETTTTDSATGTTTTTKTTTFSPEYRTKVVKYFDTYRTDPYGLPPAWVAKVRVKEMPVTWRTTVAPGVVITEKDRSYLVDAPPDLIKVLPAPATGVHYYVAGSNVVAVDADYKIVDSISIPSIKFKDD